MRAYIAATKGIPRPGLQRFKTSNIYMRDRPYVYIVAAGVRRLRLARDAHHVYRTRPQTGRQALRFFKKVDDRMRDGRAET